MRKFDYDKITATSIQFVTRFKVTIYCQILIRKAQLVILAFNWPVKRYEKQSDTDFEGNSSNLCRTHLTLSQVSITICNVMDGTLCHLCTTFQSNLSKNHKQSIQCYKYVTKEENLPGILDQLNLKCLRQFVKFYSI